MSKLALVCRRAKYGRSFPLSCFRQPLDLSDAAAAEDTKGGNYVEKLVDKELLPGLESSAFPMNIMSQNKGTGGGLVSILRILVKTKLLFL